MTAATTITANGWTGFLGRELSLVKSSACWVLLQVRPRRNWRASSVFSPTRSKAGAQRDHETRRHPAGTAGCRSHAEGSD